MCALVSIKRPDKHKKVLVHDKVADFFDFFAHNQLVVTQESTLHQSFWRELMSPNFLPSIFIPNSLFQQERQDKNKSNDRLD